MSDKRDDRVDEKLGKISSLVKHSDREEQKVVALDEAKKDILNELPAQIRFQALQNGMSFDELRELYAEVKEEYAFNKLDSHGGHRFQNNERRQDNVHEREVDKNLQRQRELIHGRGGRLYEHQRVHG